jgi:hypothetical protein
MKEKTLFNEMEQFKPDIVRFDEVCTCIKGCIELRIFISESLIDEYNKLLKKI